MISQITKLFPVWALLFSALAFFWPGPFAGLRPAIVPLLAVVMFGMGMTLRWDDFRRVVRDPKTVLVGVVLQFSVMPLAAWLLSRALGLSPDFMAGMLLVGSSAGGTASNVICYLAGGNVALSVAMTTTSTILAIIATPSLTWLYLNQTIPVPFWDMLLSILQVVLLPVVVGTTINSFLGEKIARFKSLFPLISVIVIVVLIAIIVALNQSRFAGASVLLVLAVVLHNTSGLAAGYYVSRLLGYDQKISRTIAIEVGMQNSGLSVALAIKHFSAIAALPGAIFSLWHNLSGAFLARKWSHQPVSEMVETVAAVD